MPGLTASFRMSILTNMKNIPPSRYVFGTRGTAIFLSDRRNTFFNSHLDDRWEDYTGRLASMGISFLYPPLLEEADDAGIEALLDYHFPYVEKGVSTYDVLKTTLSDPTSIAGLFGVETSSLPCLVHVGIEGREGTTRLRVHPLVSTDPSSVDAAIESLLKEERAVSRVQHSVGGRQPAETPSDRDFEEASRLLSTTLKSEIEAEIVSNRGMGAMRVMLFLLRRMRDMGIPLEGQSAGLLSGLGTIGEDRLSRLVVPANGPLILPDYGKEILLTPLQKTVYLFFLNHPEGVLFKSLPYHRDELLSIYRKLSNKSSMEEVVRSVDVLSNPLENSMSEKCARIKEAFLRAMDDRLAMLYYVRGGRNEPKKIHIDRGLVSL